MCTAGRIGTTRRRPPTLPAWQSLAIVDVDGVTFTLADCIGTPVLVELFATWCSNCRQQLPKTQEAAVTMGDRRK